jgi:hypothetical protein
MSTQTKKLKLLKKSVAEDGADTFNVDTMLNDNWDKVDSFAKEAGDMLDGCYAETQSHIKDTTKHITASERTKWDNYDRRFNGYLPLSGGTLAGAITVPEDMTVISQRKSDGDSSRTYIETTKGNMTRIRSTGTIASKDSSTALSVATEAASIEAKSGDDSCKLVVNSTGVRMVGGGVTANNHLTTKKYVDDSVAASGVKIATGSYIGTGTGGSSNPTSLSFDFAPDLMIIIQDNEVYNAKMIYIKGCSYMWSLSLYITSTVPFNGRNVASSENGGKTIKWYCDNYSGDDAAASQFNERITNYRYFAIGLEG